jgi:hypothetical protein
MNGPDHYRMADRILRDSRLIDIGEEDGLPVASYDDATRKNLLGALVHAVLALTAATAEPYGERHRPYVSSGERDERVAKDWSEAIS